MKTIDFTKSITSNQIKENINKMFGASINLESYSREQLEDMRNKLRTKVFQQEGQSGINDLLTNETYQKNKALLDLLNTRIKEMLGEDIKKLKDKLQQLDEAKKGVRAPKYTKKSHGSKSAKDYDGDGKVESPKDEVWGSRAKAAAKAGKPFSEGSKPDFLDLDKDGNKKEPMKKAAKEKTVAEKTLTGAEKKKKEEIVKSMKTNKAEFKDRYGKRGEEVMHATATKIAKKKAEESVDEGSTGDYSATKARAGKDIGKPGKQFAQIAKSAGKKYGSKERGEKVAGAVLAKLRKENFSKNVKIVNESISYLLNEDEEEKANTITAAGDIANDFTSWMQRVGQYQTKVMIELTDEIRHNFGQAEAEAFKQAVSPALSTTLETLTSQREAISNAIAALAGGEMPAAPMGTEPAASPEMPAEEPVPATTPDQMNVAPEDEFAAADAAAGAGASGREIRESTFVRKLAESHSIISKLAR